MSTPEKVLQGFRAAITSDTTPWALVNLTVALQILSYIPQTLSRLEPHLRASLIASQM